MAISFAETTGFFETTLDLRARRAEVLANNLANADTPHYKARDIDFKAELNRQLSGKQREGFDLARTQSRHLAGQQSVSGEELRYRVPQQPSVDGNTVEEQVEHGQYMENALAFQASFTFLNSRFKGLMNAVKGE
ncbi:flagellar basal body rod protein FlgB [Simiduia sp. 21SJ11W-1]|uniref:flagellar basal body rod protein FlgB n=1 Tax=Simiduia sp. 21SJ11W-1 TaxID=2909669 RepID=UPI00209ED8BB|nr:flagellar basal body rod protein FlgB [Simiduia sp. 21SJ11W-1]UTA49459.1 flagellar basal body rod protein FlgB [Simiduia sp. 21SJ11W-1]